MNRKARDMVPVRIASISVDSLNNTPVILLRPTADDGSFEGENVLPIWIGHPEAMAILLGIQGIEAPRPLTHDLISNTLERLGHSLDRVLITRIEEGTFYAELVLRGPLGEVRIDARPSDSMALAVRAGCPIYVAEAVLEEASVVPEPAEDEEDELERFREFLDHVEPSDFSD